MAPIVHGLERQYGERVDFVYLDVAVPKNADAKVRLGFRATPHFILLTADGRRLGEWQGVIDGKVLEAGLRSAMAATSDR
jgi:hypothetical protein